MPEERALALQGCGSTAPSSLGKDSPSPGAGTHSFGIGTGETPKEKSAPHAGGICRPVPAARGTTGGSRDQRRPSSSQPRSHSKMAAEKTRPWL